MKELIYRTFTSVLLIFILYLSYIYNSFFLFLIMLITILSGIEYSQLIFKIHKKDLDRILHGGSCKIDEDLKLKYEMSWISFANTPLAFGEVKNAIFYPIRVFNVLKSDT